MNVRILKSLGLLLAVAAVAACGSEGTKSVASAPPVTGDPVGGAHAALIAEIRIAGENPGDLTAALVEVSSLTVRHRGAELPVVLGAGSLDLARPDQAFLLGTVVLPVLPVDDAVLDVELVLDDWGGWESTASAGWMDLRGVPVRFQASTAALAVRGHVVIGLDLASSLHEGGDGLRTIVPQVSIRY